MSAERLTAQQLAAAQAFVREVMFKPYREGAAGPDAYWCWGLAQVAQRRLAGRELPIVNANVKDLRAIVRLIEQHPIRTTWSPVAAPRHLDLVTLASHKHPHHIGTWLAVDGGVVLHVTEQTTRGEPDPHKPAVICDTLMGLRAQGWHGFEFLRAPEAA